VVGEPDSPEKMDYCMKGKAEKGVVRKRESSEVGGFAAIHGEDSQLQEGRGALRGGFG